MSVEAVRVRLDEHHRRLTELEHTQPAVIATEVKELREDVRELRDKVAANTRAQWSLAVAIVVGAISLAFTALQVSGTG